MVDIENLYLFNSKGEQLQIEPDENNVFETVVPVEKTSTGLYASVSLFMFQKVLVNGKETFTKPFTTNNLDTRQFRLELESKTITDETKWFLFSSSINGDGITVLESFNQTNLDIDYQANATVNSNQPNNLPENDLNQNAFQIDIGAYSEEDGGFGDKILIIDPDSGETKMTIQLYVEFEEEDSRLDELIRSLGIHKDFNTSHWNLLSDSDPEEAKVDWNKLNAKRKELLLEYHNILPYRGTYKGLVNILKFFGYGNLEVKEYWVKPNYKENKLDKKLKTIVNNGEIDVQNDKDDRNFNKSGFFALVYKINEITGELNKLDLPITIESSEFTDRELLLKLFGLKSYLNKRWMVSTTKVIDIRGEGDWFNGVTLTGKSTYTPIYSFNQSIKPDFSIDPKVGWIVDLRNLEELLGLTTSGLPDNDITPANDSTTIDEVSDIIAAYFTDYHPTIDTKDELADAKDIDVGMPVTIKNTSFSLTVADMNIQIKSIKDFGDRTWQFELSNIATGDTFELIDTQSGESISYTVQSGDSEQDVIADLQSQAQNLNVNPWDWYEWKVDSNSEAPGNNLLIAEQLFTGDLPVRWRTKVDEGNISPGININKWKTEILFTGTRWAIDKLSLFNIDWVNWTIAHSTIDWTFTKSGLAGDVETINIQLPYEGFYNVTLEMKDYNGNISRHFEENTIEVKLQHNKVVGWRKGKSSDDKLQVKDLTQSINTFNQVSKSILLEEDQGYKSIKDLDIPIRDLKMENTLNYFDQSETSLYKIDRLPNIDTLNYDIKDILIAGATRVENFSNIAVNKMKNLNIEQTLFLGDLSENFTLINIAQGDVLQIELSDGRTGVYTLTSSNILTEAQNLNQSSDEVMSEFVWNPVENAMGNYVQLQGVRKDILGNRDKSTIADYTNNQFEIKDHFPSIMTNPSWYNLIYLKEPYMSIPLGSFCVFTPNSGPALGKNKINWEIKNIKRNEIDYSVDSVLFSWFFNEVASWELTLTFEDTNGNEYNNTVKIKSE